MIYIIPTIISSIKIIRSSPFMLRPSRTVAGLFILRQLMWICHLIFSLGVISIIFNTRNYWIDCNDIGFDNVYVFWFWPAKTNFVFLSADIGFWLALFIVVDRCKKIPLWWWSNATCTSDGGVSLFFHCIYSTIYTEECLSVVLKMG